MEFRFSEAEKVAANLTPFGVEERAMCCMGKGGNTQAGQVNETECSLRKIPWGSADGKFANKTDCDQWVAQWCREPKNMNNDLCKCFTSRWYNNGQNLPSFSATASVACVDEQCIDLGYKTAGMLQAMTSCPAICQNINVQDGVVVTDGGTFKVAQSCVQDVHNSGKGGGSDGNGGGDGTNGGSGGGTPGGGGSGNGSGLPGGNGGSSGKLTLEIAGGVLGGLLILVILIALLRR